jgi:hypothetical protein
MERRPLTTLDSKALDHMLILLTDSSVTVGPSPALVIFTTIMVMAICAGIVTAIKGLWIC